MPAFYYLQPCEGTNKNLARSLVLKTFVRKVNAMKLSTFRCRRIYLLFSFHSTLYLDNGGTSTNKISLILQWWLRLELGRLCMVQF